MRKKKRNRFFFSSHSLCPFHSVCTTFFFLPVLNLRLTLLHQIARATEEEERKKTKKSVLLLLNVCSTGTIISLAFIMFNGIPDVNRRVVSGIEIVVEGTRARERGICDVRIKRGRMFL